MQIVGIAVWVLWVLVLFAAGAVCECFLVIAIVCAMEFNSFLHVQKIVCTNWIVTAFVQIWFDNFAIANASERFGFRMTKSLGYIKSAFPE